MIPVALPSVQFVLFASAFLAATVAWAIWLLYLTFNPRSRQRLCSWRGLVFVVLTGIGSFTIWYLYTTQRSLEAYKAEHREKFQPVLSEDQRLGGIDMPAGTALTLAIEGKTESFKRAEFPHPVLINGIEALSVERYVLIDSDANYKATGFTPESLRLSGLGKSRQNGWICDATAPISFETHPDGEIRKFTGCIAADGNFIEGKPLSQGAEIIATEGTLYLDGRRGIDRWLVHLPQAAGLSGAATEREGGSLLLDADRNVVEQTPH